MKKLIILSFFLICTFHHLNAQNLLNLGYNHGTSPTNINYIDVTNAYTSWKNTFTESCGDDRIRVKFDTSSQTVSEGIGYGMLIAAFAGDQELLDGLWNYYTDFLNNNGVMNWKIEGCSSVLGFNGATDAELDAAMALIIADKRWGSTGTVNYLSEVTDFINVIRTHEIEPGTFVLKPGDVWGGSATTNISYFAPAYYSAYKTISGDTSWDNIIDKSYDIIDANQAKTGAVYNLVSDWCKADGDFSTEVSWAKFEGKKYDYDASRTPWRIALDYLWTGNTRALDYANKCIDFVNSKNGLNNIYPGYNLDGSAYETSYKDVTFTGAYAIALMASSNQTDVNNAYTKVVEMTTDAYFGNTLRVLYLLTLSGNFYSPEHYDATLSNHQFNKDNSNTLLYPNPVSNYIKLNFTNVKSNNVKIVNIGGSVVFEKTYQNISSIEIPIQHLAEGVYFIYTNDYKSKFIKK